MRRGSGRTIILALEAAKTFNDFEGRKSYESRLKSIGVKRARRTWICNLIANALLSQGRFVILRNEIYKAFVRDGEVYVYANLLVKDGPTDSFKREREVKFRYRTDRAKYSEYFFVGDIKVSDEDAIWFKRATFSRPDVKAKKRAMIDSFFGGGSRV